MSRISSLAQSLAAWSSATDRRAEVLLDDVLHGRRPCYVLGRNEHSAWMVRRLDVQGVIDDFVDTPGDWRGVRVVRSAQLAPGAVVLNAVLHKRPHTARAKLAQLPGRPELLDYAHCMRIDPERFPALPFVQEARDLLDSRGQELETLASRLADAESARCLQDVFLYRLTGDPDFTTCYSLSCQRQYFDIDLGLPEDRAVFVDGGAYCGETTEEFCRLHPGYGAVHVFEPNAASMQVARNRLRDLRDIHFHSCALGERRSQLHFDGSAANASRISEEGSSVIEVAALDEMLSGHAHLLKYDLEGYEVRALEGARKLISRWHPALAICVYHRAADFVDVPAKVLDMHPDYTLRMRHYTEGWEETVLYCTP